MKYTLKSRYGNVIKHTDSERKRDRLLELGYTLVEKTIPKVKKTKETTVE